jgi:cytochrome b subunit of formate dehydrogenase
MFRPVATTLFLATFAVLFLHCVISPCSAECRWTPKGIIRRLAHLFTLIFLEQKLSLVGVLRKLVYLLALLCFVVLAVTGFYPLLVLNEHISGYFVMVHATFAPVFAVCLAVLAVMSAGGNRLNKTDFPLLQRLIRKVTHLKIALEEVPLRSRLLALKITFWLIVFLGLPLILSIILSMFRFFGTDWQEFLLAAHRWTALVFAVVAIVHTYLVVRTQMRQ